MLTSVLSGEAPDSVTWCSSRNWWCASPQLHQLSSGDRAPRKVRQWGRASLALRRLARIDSSVSAKCAGAPARRVGVAARRCARPAPRARPAPGPGTPARRAPRRSPSVAAAVRCALSEVRCGLRAAAVTRPCSRRSTARASIISSRGPEVGERGAQPGDVARRYGARRPRGRSSPRPGSGSRTGPAAAGSSLLQGPAGHLGRDVLPGHRGDEGAAARPRRASTSPRAVTCCSAWRSVARLTPERGRPAPAPAGAAHRGSTCRPRSR